MPKVYYDRGMIHKIKGNAQLAIEDLQKAAALFSAQGNMEYFQQVQDIINELQQ